MKKIIEINQKSSWQIFRQIITLIIFIIIIPAVIAIGVMFFKDRMYSLISVIIAFLACVPFFIRFEKMKRSARELVVIAVMTGLSVVGRLIFAPIPGFKPVTAMIIIVAISFGGEVGFIVGALTAIISNIYLMPGAWTAFQMFSWGIIGYVSGIVAKTGIMKKWWALVIAGTLGGIIFSLLMDIWTVLSMYESFGIKFYLVAISKALPMMGVYVASNIIFLLILAKPIGEKLDRIKIKYNIFH